MVYKIICFRICLYHIFGYLTIILYKISLQHKKTAIKQPFLMILKENYCFLASYHSCHGVFSINNERIAG